MTRRLRQPRDCPSNAGSAITRIYDLLYADDRWWTGDQIADRLDLGVTTVHQAAKRHPNLIVKDMRLINGAESMRAHPVVVYRAAVDYGAVPT